MAMSLDGFIADLNDQVGELFDWHEAVQVSVASHSIGFVVVVVSSAANLADPQPASGVYIDRKGAKRRTGLPAKFALRSAPGSPTSSPDSDPVARIGSMRSPTCAACSMSAVGVPVPLEDDALGLTVIEADVVLQCSGVLGPHDVHALSGQALELLDLALVKREPSDTQKLTHCLGLRRRASDRP
jgi:hypothetical protein